MDKKLLIGIGIGAVALYLYLNRNKLAALKNAPASAPANKPSTPAPATKPSIPATPSAKPEEKIFVDDRHLPSWADSLVTPSTEPTIPLNRELFEIPFSPDNILPKGLEYNYGY